MIVVDIQQLEEMIDQIHKCLRDVFIDVLRLPKRSFALAVEGERCIATRECAKHR